MKFTEVETSTNLIPKNGMTIVRALFIWGLVALFYFYDNLLQVSPSAMKPELTSIFTPEAEQFGSLSAYCLYAYGLMQIPAGILLDKFGPRRIITLACSLCTLGSFVFGMADSLWIAKLGRVFIGAGAAFALLCCLKVVSLWLPRSRYALMTGLTVTVGYLGGAFGLAFVVKIVESLGWRESMYLGGGIGLLLCFFLWLFVKEKNKSEEIAITPSITSANTIVNGDFVKAETKKIDAYSGSVHSSIKNVNNLNGSKQNLKAIFADIFSTLSQNLKVIVKSKQTWIAAIYAGLMFVPTLALGGLWGIPFLVEAHGFEREAAGFSASLMYVGWVVGGSFWGFVSDYFGRRNLPMIIGNVVTLGITFAIVYCNDLSLPVVKSMFFALGFFSSSFIIAFAVVAESNPRGLAATASGFTNAINTLWGALAQPFIGLILDFTSAKAAVQAATGVATTTAVAATSGATTFSLAQYQTAFLTLPICLVMSFIFLMFLKETYCGRRSIVSESETAVVLEASR